MRNNSRNEANVIAAFIAGNRRDFASAVSGFGVANAADVLSCYLIDGATGISSLRITNRFLFEAKTLRGIPQGSDLAGLMLRALTSMAGGQNRKCEIIEALVPHIQAIHLKGIDLLSLGHDGATLIAENVPNLPNPQTWIKAAYGFHDSNLAERFTPFLSPVDRFELWMDWAANESKLRMTFLLEHEIQPDTDDERKIVFDMMEYDTANQAVIVDLLRRAWPEIAATLKIRSLTSSASEFWSGRSLAYLLESGAEMDRKDWSSIFRWEYPPTLIMQIDKFTEFNRWIDWNLANEDGHGFLEEVYCKMASAKPGQRIPILTKLLEVGANPAPLTTTTWNAKLSAQEISLLRTAATAWTTKKRVLAVPPAMPAVVVEIDLA